MIKVFDNLLPPALVDRLEERLTSDNFYWFAMDNLSLGTQTPKNEFTFPDNYKHIESSGMTKPLFMDSLWYDPHDAYMMSRMIIDYVCEEENIDLHGIIRVKANMLTPNPASGATHDNAIHYPHLDVYNEHLVMVYYVNDSDGDTVIFNERWSEDAEQPVPLTIKQRIKPKKGRIVLFDGLHFHTSQSPKENDKRIILNINIV